MEERIKAIEERNQRVEADKKWETSLIRIVSIGVVTYGVVVLFVYFTNNYLHTDNPFIVGVIPVLGFILGTLSLRFIRKLVGY